MIRCVVGLVLSLLVLAGPAMAAEVRFRAGVNGFVFSLPAGYCDALAAEGGLSQDLEPVRQRGLDVKAMGVPCGRTGELRAAARAGRPLRVLVFGVLTRDGDPVPTDGSGRVFWQALHNSTRYLNALAGSDAILTMVREVVEQRQIPVDVSAIELSTDTDMIGAAVAGTMARVSGAAPFSAAAIAEPVADIFLVTSVVEFATVAGRTADLAAARDLRTDLRKID